MSSKREPTSFVCEVVGHGRMTDRELMELIMGNKTLKSSRTVDQAAMSVAYLWAEARSKDPSTKVGACIVDAKSGGLFLGYNGFPPGIPDDASVWNLRTDMSEDRVRPVEGFELTKYDLVVHAEVNAVRKALQANVDLRMAYLITTMFPCPRCMKDVVVSNGLTTVIYGDETYKSQTPRDRWLVGELARLGGVRMVKMHEKLGMLKMED